MSEKQQLIFGDISSINKTYGTSGKNLYKKRVPRKIKQITNKDVEDAKKFKIFCEKKGYIKNGFWDYEALVIEVNEKGGKYIKNLNLNDVAKMYEVNKKNIKKYFTLKDKKELTFVQQTELKKLREEIVF